MPPLTCPRGGTGMNSPGTQPRTLSLCLQGYSRARASSPEAQPYQWVAARAGGSASVNQSFTGHVRMEHLGRARHSDGSGTTMVSKEVGSCPQGRYSLVREGLNLRIKGTNMNCNCEARCKGALFHAIEGSGGDLGVVWAVREGFPEGVTSGLQSEGVGAH